jgi:uncharacterized protein (TIGR02246 family)
VEQEVSWLIDRTKIRELTARYGRCFDDGDAEGFAATFVEDGEMAVGTRPPTKGREALAEMCRTVPFAVLHATVDPIIEIDGDRATQRVTVLVYQKAADRSEKPQLTATGRYEDELVRTPGGWLFERRTAFLDGWKKKT